MKYELITVASAIPATRVADVDYNVKQIVAQACEAEAAHAEVVVFPELCVTGYTCQDLFGQDALLRAAESGVEALCQKTQGLDVAIIVGTPIATGCLLLNCALVLQHGHVWGAVIKEYLPNYGEFYEKRWFASSRQLTDQTVWYAGQQLQLSQHPRLFCLANGARFGIELCEDLWAPCPPSTQLALAGADLIFNLSASDELIGKHAYLRSLVMQQSARTMTGYVYSSCGFGESTQDVVYGGNAFVCENGRMLAAAERFMLSPQLVLAQIDLGVLRHERRHNTTFAMAQQEGLANMVHLEPGCHEHPFVLIRELNPTPFIPKSADMDATCGEIFNIQVAGLAKRLVHTHCQHVVVGISGGLDSTLALLVCVFTFDKLGYDRKGIVGVTMPGFGTTDRTYHNAIDLMEQLGVTIREISIAKAVTQHFADIGHDASNHDVTYENSQARERTQILMDISNQVGGLVIGTGDLSELALGWATYNGDHMSMYGVNVSIPKTLIKYLVQWAAQTPTLASSADTLTDVLDTPISPELTPADEQGNIAQKTEDLVGPYELHDFFLFHTLRQGCSPDKIYFLACHAFDGRYTEEVIAKWLRVFMRRFFAQQFKRSCLPDGPKVGSVSLSPRGDWRMPSDASSAAWTTLFEECGK